MAVKKNHDRLYEPIKGNVSSKILDSPSQCYFSQVVLDNVRCFKNKQTLELTSHDGSLSQWTIIVGENGVGKTTLLECLAALQVGILDADNMRFQVPLYTQKRFNRSEIKPLGDPKSSDYLISSIISWNGKIGQVNSSNVAGFSIEKQGSNITHSSSETILKNLSALRCYCYGGSRSVGKVTIVDTSDVLLTFDLFEDNPNLLNAESWLLQADYAVVSDVPQAKKQYERIKNTVIAVLPGVTDIRFRPELSVGFTPQPQLKTEYGWVSFANLSLGYKVSITWIIDLAARLFYRYPSSSNPLAEPAIVLIDEIDLHLHPRWQRKLFEVLSKTFPNTQFVVTTHSPLVVQAISNANIVLLRRERNTVVIDNNPEGILGWRVDQILTSELFDLPSSRPPSLDVAFKERQAILSKSTLSDSDEERLNALEREIGNLSVGETPDDIHAADLIRRAAAYIQG